MRVVYYVTGHGLGHATRVIEICKALLQAGHHVCICTSAPHEVFQKELPFERLSLRTIRLDCGVSQQDAFTVDMKKSLEEYHEVAEVGRAAKLEKEVAWLQSQEADLVVSDIVPLACAVAALAGVPSVCVTNFTWDFIYSEHLTYVGSHFRRLVWQIAEDYARADLLLRLPGHCPMPAFREVVDVPLVSRKAKKPPEQVRRELGLSEAEKLVVLMFGGWPAGDWQLRADSLPADWRCIVCSGGKLPGGKPLPSNFILADKECYTPDLIAACTCVLGKIGYGTVSECLAHHKPLVFIRRDFFNEEPFLRKQLEMYNLGVEMPRRDFLQGRWQAYVTHAATLKSTYSQPTNGAEVVADMLSDLVEDSRSRRGSDQELRKAVSSLALRRAASLGAVRLKDVVCMGLMMQRHALNEKVEVPEWYSQGQSPTSPSPLASTTTSPAKAPPAALESWDLLDGSLAALEQCPDSCQFLAMLSELDLKPLAGSAAELPERRASRGLFRWEDDIWVSRAPGRLDVMGGIADYSGSLVLQMPIAPACHVAAQKHPPDAPLRLWRHIAARHAAAGGEKPVLRIVSMNSDRTNRGHAFDMDLSELQQDGAPLPYAEARKYFRSDPSQSWAAYVAGALLVLMHEEGHVFTEGLSLLIHSEVPDGKGVSSSAALEVAAMSAIAAAYGVHLEGSKLAALCQKVENLVVGAPCGVMDQMASALGKKDSLMALRCQPAQVLPPVSIPSGLRFWGIDSGVRHSVGGLDYGTVRAAAFMGLKIISSKADALARQGSRLPRAHEAEKTTIGTGKPQPVGGGYLTNITPSAFRQFYFDLPSMLRGSEFLEWYGQHWDAATQIEPEVRYPVAQAAAHPVEENFRVQCFRQLLQTFKPGDTEAPVLLGELMYQSHASYSRCGLGSEATDRLVALTRAEVALAQAAGEAPALYGAKITGGGSGGTVCILGRDNQEGEDALKRVIAAYSDETGGFAPTVLAGSSLGAAAFGTLRLRLKTHQLQPTLSAVSP